MRHLRSLPSSLSLAAVLVTTFAFAPPSLARSPKAKSTKAAKSSKSKKGKSPAAAKKDETPEPNPIADAQQLVLVVADDWGSSIGTLRRYKRGKPGGTWQAVGGKLNAVLGKSGLAWGKGLHGAAPNPPVKKEGDGRTPAGAFGFGTAFGLDAAPPAGLKLPYQVIGRDTECIDDSASSRYNTMIDRSQVKQVDWHSAERMMRTDGRYGLGVVVQHNTDSPVASAGSCTFLQLRIDPPGGATAVGTSGGTALEESDLKELMTWIDPAEKPVIVQLPAPELKRRRAAWGLPSDK